MNKLLNIFLLSSVICIPATYAMESQDPDIAAAVKASLEDEEAVEMARAAERSLQEAEDEAARNEQGEFEAAQEASLQEEHARRQKEAQEREAQQKANAEREEAEALALAQQMSLEALQRPEHLDSASPAPQAVEASVAVPPVVPAALPAAVAVAGLQPAQPGFLRRLFRPSLTTVGIVGLAIGAFWIMRNRSSQ